jgi:glycine/serine hydroxymethyltransferase
MAHRLEANWIITNYQALPGDLSFSDASGIRLGVQEMTRFGMQEADFGELAELMADILRRDRERGEAVSRLRSRFTTMRFCLPVEDGEELMSGLIDAFLGSGRDT